MYLTVLTTPGHAMQQFAVLYIASPLSILETLQWNIYGSNKETLELLNQSRILQTNDNTELNEWEVNIYIP